MWQNRQNRGLKIQNLFKTLSLLSLRTVQANHEEMVTGKLYCENEIINVNEVTHKVLMAYSNKNITGKLNLRDMSNKLLSRLFHGDVKWTISSTYKLAWSLQTTACKLASQLHLIKITVMFTGACVTANVAATLWSNTILLWQPYLNTAAN